MNTDYFKFPSTPHLISPVGQCIRPEKVMDTTSIKRLLLQEVSIEEKIDGANLGIAFDYNGNIHLQNRGHYLLPPFTGQWSPLTKWVNLHQENLFDILLDRFILFGEWCYAKHSIFYNQLPDWFIAFDIFDKKEQKFFSRERRDLFVSQLGLYVVPLISFGYFSLTELKEISFVSRFGNELNEGIYIRYDDKDWLIKRAKLVRPEFCQTITVHWGKGKITPNILATNIKN